jgi:hypothetical protein
MKDKNKLLGIIVLHSKWNSLFPPKFPITNSENKTIKYELEKLYFRDFLKDQPAILSNSELVLK